MKGLHHGSDVTVLENQSPRLARSPDGNIDHRSGQVVGPNHLIREEQPKRGIDYAKQSVTETWFFPRFQRIDVGSTNAGLAVELAPIRVNAVSPGVVRTNLWQSMSAPERERLYESVGKSLPVGRVGEAHEIAQAYLFLMQEGFSTGQTIVVDGATVLV
jgi:enoyl-ACP reductase-like protein